MSTDSWNTTTSQFALATALAAGLAASPVGLSSGPIVLNGAAA
jgi:hypothetical protein